MIALVAQSYDHTIKTETENKKKDSESNHNFSTFCFAIQSQNTGF